MNHAKVHSEGQHDQPAQHRFKSKRFSMDDVVAEESKELHRMEHLVLDKVSNIQFCVDGAVGMPNSATASRVTARLLDHDRRQIGEPSASTVSQPDSPVASPIFDLQAGWRGNPHLSLCFLYEGLLLNSFLLSPRKHADTNNYDSVQNRHIRKTTFTTSLCWFCCIEALCRCKRSSTQPRVQ